MVTTKYRWFPTNTSALFFNFLIILNYYYCCFYSNDHAPYIVVTTPRCVSHAIRVRRLRLPNFEKIRSVGRSVGRTDGTADKYRVADAPRGTLTTLRTIVEKNEIRDGNFKIFSSSFRLFVIYFRVPPTGKKKKKTSPLGTRSSRSLDINHTAPNRFGQIQSVASGEVEYLGRSHGVRCTMMAGGCPIRGRGNPSIADQTKHDGFAELAV
ncbi:unnamed protein product [Aphis gossypii]|uniref:Uncharacterized protein n=1 Tax=Aphis gossypii TaxID=80765 RepID=A0A9P0ISA3_APHGO|nr:unnamed protein product [Aphis gossypii]